MNENMTGTPIEELDFSVRTYNCLKRARIDTVEQLQRLDDEQLMRIRNLGRWCVAEIRQKVKQLTASAPVTGTGKRLTFEGNFCDIAMCTAVPGGSFCESGYCSQRKVWERLKQYEDAEEQGRLLVLPCKVGDSVWIKGDEYKITSVVVHMGERVKRDIWFGAELVGHAWKARCGFSSDQIGKTVFLHPDEAEKALMG